MDDYVRRGDVVEKIRYEGIYGSGYSNEEREDDVVGMIDSVESADVRPERYARKVKFYNEPWTGNKFTTCTACYGKVGPHDKFCKHCGAKFQEGETNDNHG